MKHMKKLLSFVLALTLCLGMVPGLAIPAYAAGSDFEIENGVLKKYTGASADVVIPNGVTEIDAHAFDGKPHETVRSIVFPEGITEIPNGCFSWFYILERVVFPQSLISIGDHAFTNLDALKEINLPNGLKTIGTGVLSNCNSLTSVTIPDSVTKIGSSAFSQCSSLVNITLPSNPSISFGGGVFYDTPWLKNTGNANGGLVIIGDTLVGNSFDYTTRLGNLVIPQGVRVIAGEALSHLNMTSVTIPEGVEVIDYRAFSGSSNLTELNLPSTIKSVGYYTFYYCPGLTEVTFPAGLEEIDKLAFDDCSNLKTVTILGSGTKIGDRSFPLTTTIRGWRGSDAERYANYHFNTFEPLDGSSQQEAGGGKESPVTADPSAKAAETANAGNQNYDGSHAKTIKSYLYQRQDGNFTRVECPSMSYAVVVEVYDRNFKLLAHKEIPTELRIWGGFFAGEQYNFLIFGDYNSQEDNQKEVIRVVKYSKDWERLDSWSGYGMNTVTPFDFATVRCAEKDGILTVRTGHVMYKSKLDGLNHQANLAFSVRQSDMTSVTSAGTSNFSYVSHSFNQFVLVEEDGVMATLDHGDAYPRAFVVNIHPDYRRGVDSADFTFGRTDAATVPLVYFPGATGDNATGAQAGGFEASKTHYLASVTIKAGLDKNRNPVSDEGIMVYAVDKKTRAVTKYQIATAKGISDQQSLSNTQLVKFSDDKFLLLWEIRVTGGSAGIIYYTFLDGSGKPAGNIMTARGYLSDCKPILADGKAVWYSAGTSWWKEGAPAFYTIDANGNLTGTTDPSLLPSPWAREQVDEAIMLGLVPINLDGYYTEPNYREMFCDMADTLYSKTVPTKITATVKFTDTVDPAVERMATVGVVAGIGSGLFDPYSDLTREQAATMLYRLAAAAGKPLPDVTPSFADNGSISSWASKEVGAVQAAGIMNGVGDGRFDPQGSYTYEQSILTMLRMYHYLTQ